MCLKYAFVILLIPLMPAMVLGGAPFKSDDPGVVEFGHWEFYLASEYSHDTYGKSMTLPHMEINYGLIPNVQIHLLMPFANVKPDGHARRYGYGDTELGINCLLLKETKYFPQVGTFPLVEIPTGNESRGLGTGHVQLFLPLWIQKTWGPWTTYGGGGYWNNPGEGFRDWWSFGWVVQREMCKALSLGAELYYHTAFIDDTGDNTGYTIGAIVGITEHHHLLLSAGQDLSGPNYFNSYFAYLLTF